MTMKKLEQNCVGIGLVALDVLLNGNPKTPARFYAGGSCGNVMAILSFLGWNTFPIARLKNDKAADILIQDFQKFGVNPALISVKSDGSTPIIIHRVLKDKAGKPKHRFEFRDPDSGKYLPSYKPVLSSNVDEILDKKPGAKVFFFDRVNRSSIDIAKKSKAEGSMIFFEPSSIKMDNQTKECLSLADIVKFSRDRVVDYDLLFPICDRFLEIRTLGENGLEYRTKGQSDWRHIPAYKIDCVVDAAGSGDWCTSGIIYKLFEDKTPNKFTTSNIENALKFGQVLGAINCGFLGARGIMYAITKSDLIEGIGDFLSTKDYNSFCLLNSNLIFEPEKSESLKLLYS